jgi:hypothetical protein
MCIAILNTKTKIKDSYIKNSWDNNDQGGGIMWIEDGVLMTYKTFNYKDFINSYKRIRKSTDSKIVLHFRIATSGYKGLENLHPFLVNDNLGFVHNGVISGLGNKEHSDTYQFNEMLKSIQLDFIENEFINTLISKYIGHSKLIFLNSNNEHKIINEHLGHWIGDDWYSNDSYLSYNDFSYFGDVKIPKQKSKFSPIDIDYIDDMDSVDYERKRFCKLTGYPIDGDGLDAEIFDWMEYLNLKNLRDVNDSIEYDIYSDEILS